MVGCLIIHGYTGGPYEVEPLRAYLAEKTDWEVYVPVLPGHQKTYEEQLTLEGITYEKWLEAAKQALYDLHSRYDKVYVIGFSMGGMIAAYLAATEKVDKLVLLSTARKYLSFKYLGQYIGEMIGDRFKGKLLENEMYIHYKSKVELVPLRANLEFMKLVRLTKQHLKDIDTPVFIAQGEKDGMVPASTIHALDKEIDVPYKEMVFFEQSSHLICLGEDGDVLKRMVYKFLHEDLETTDSREL